MVPFIADAGRREILRPAAVVVRFIKGAPYGGMNPHFLFGCAEKKTAVHGQKKRRLGAKRRFAPYLLVIRGSQQETAGETFGRSVGRGPGLAEFFSHAPATKCSRASGLQDRFDLLLPAAAALPISQRLVSIFYPGSAERSGERGKRRTVHSTTTPKAAPTPPTAGKHFFVPTDPSAPGRRLSIYGGTDSLDPRFAQT